MDLFTNPAVFFNNAEKLSALYNSKFTPARAALKFAQGAGGKVGGAKGVLNNVRKLKD